MKKATKPKFVKSYVYEGLGFPIILLNVPFVKAAGVWTPNLNYIQLQEQVLVALSHKPSPFTGSEIHFIRAYLEMTREVFGAHCNLTSAEVSCWEEAMLKPVKMSPHAKRCLQRLILTSKQTDTKARPQSLRRPRSTPARRRSLTQSPA